MTEWGIDTLFNPGKRHMDEEKRRLQSTREEIGDSSGGRRIDLDGGVVRIARKPTTEADDAEIDDAETDDAETNDLKTDEPEADEPDQAELKTDEPEAAEPDQAEPAVETTAAAGGSAAERARARRRR